MAHSGSTVPIFAIPPFGKMTANGVSIYGRSNSRNPPIEATILERPFKECERSFGEYHVGYETERQLADADSVLRIRRLCALLVDIKFRLHLWRSS